MTRKVTRNEKLNKNALAIAIHLTSRNEVPITAKQCMNELLQKVKELTRSSRITLTDLQNSLKQWVDNRWAVIKDNVLQITRAGRHHIKKLAEAASSTHATA